MSATEYKAMKVRIRIDGDELIWSKGGRIDRALDTDVIHRMPLDCISAVVSKMSRMSGGWICLVIGDAKVPKASLWAVSDQPWMAQFRAGEVKDFRELEGIINQRIAANRAAGRDPAKARRPYLDQSGSDVIGEVKEQAFGGTLILPNSQADAVALARANSRYSSSWTDLDSLPARLREGEAVTALALGSIGMTPVLVGVTDARIAIHADSPASQVRDEMPRPVQVSWNSAVISGGLTFCAEGREMTIKALDDATARGLADAAE